MIKSGTQKLANCSTSQTANLILLPEPMLWKGCRGEKERKGEKVVVVVLQSLNCWGGAALCQSTGIFHPQQWSREQLKGLLLTLHSLLYGQDLNQATNQLPEHVYAQRTMKPYRNDTLSRYIKWQTLLYNQYHTYFE